MTRQHSTPGRPMGQGNSPQESPPPRKWHGTSGLPGAAGLCCQSTHPSRSAEGPRAALQRSARLSERFIMSNGPLWNRLVRVTAVLIAISALCFSGAESENAPPPPPLPIPAREFTTLQCIAIQDAISRLASRNFAERQAAQQLLVAAGGNGVPALTEAAQSEERE